MYVFEHFRTLDTGFSYPGNTDTKLCDTAM